MSILFISHSSKNNDAAVKVRDWLRAEGYDNIFLDLDPQQGLAPGHRWQDELKRAGERCAAVIVLVSPHWVASRWCLTEFLLAAQLGKQIFPILIAPTPWEELPPELVAHFQIADISDPAIEETGFATLAIGLKRAGLGPKDFLWPPPGEPNRAPYRGLSALQEQDAAIFFGRDAAITKGLDTLRRIRGGGERMLVILGASGSGKSSFLQAGLVARLRRDEANFVVLPVIRPERAALTGPRGLNASLGRQITSVADVVRSFEAARASVADRHKRFAELGMELHLASNPTVVLAVDQGEEFFASENAEAATVLDLIAGALAADPNALAILTIRSDTYELVQQEARLAAVSRLPYDLPPLPQWAFKETIEGPARLAGITIDPELTERLLSDLDARDSLPLLAFTLERLALLRDGLGNLDLDDYETGLRGVSGAIQSAVDDAMSKARSKPELPDTIPEILDLTRQLFLSYLVSIDDVTIKPRRRVAHLSEIPQAARPLVHLFVDQRLLVTDQSAAEGETTVEITHEAILRHWPELIRWIEGEREALVRLEGLRRAATEWDRANRPSVLLVHRGARLDDADRLLERTDLSLTIGNTDRAYLIDCHAAAQRDARRARMVLGSIVGLIAVTGAVVLVGLLAIMQMATAADQRRSDSLAALADTAVETENSDRALRLALAAYGYGANAILSTNSTKALAALTYAITTTPELRLPPLRHNSKVRNAVFSPDGARVVTASNDHTALIWNAETGVPIGPPLQHDDIVYIAAFSPDGARVVTASNDHTARIWDAETGVPIGPPLKHDSLVSSAAFSPNGTRIVTASNDHTARIWDAEAGVPIGPPLKHDGHVESATFSPGGTRIVTASDDHTARIWDAETGAPVSPPLRGHSEAVRSATFSADGTRIVTASDDHTARIWDVETAASVGPPLRGHSEAVRSATFSPDGTRIVTASNDRTARIWSAETAEPDSPPIAHHDIVVSAVFSPDGTRVATASVDGTSRIWEASIGKAVGQPLRHSYPVYSAAFSPDGTRVVTASGDAARIWSTSLPDGPSFRHNGSINSAAFSPDGALVVTASSDRTSRIWDAETGSPVGPPLRHNDSVISATFSPDGTRIMTTSDDEITRIWDTASGKLTEPPSKLDRRIAIALFGAIGNRVVITMNTRSASVFNLPPGSPGLALRHDYSINSAVLSPDGTRVVTASLDKTARIWDAETGVPIGPPLKHDESVESATFSPDGTRIVTASDDHTARIWDAETGAPVSPPLRHNKSVYSATFSPDGTRVLTVSNDRTARIWNAAMGAPVGLPLKHDSFIYSATFSPDGTQVLTASHDGIARIWNVARTVIVFRGDVAVDRACDHLLPGDDAVLRPDELEMAPFIDPDRDFAERGNVCKPRGALARLFSALW